MSASMAEVIDRAIGEECHHYALNADPDTPGGCKPCWDLAQRVAEQLAANGFGDVREARAQALEDAAAVLARLPYVSPFGQGRETYERMLAVRRGNTDAWLKARAAEERKP